MLITKPIARYPDDPYCLKMALSYRKQHGDKPLKELDKPSVVFWSFYIKDSTFTLELVA